MKTISQIIIQNLFDNDSFHKKVIPFIKSEYFEHDEEQIMFRHISNYSQKFSRVPTLEAVFIEMGNDKTVTEGQASKIDSLLTVLKEKDIQIKDEEWLLEKTEEFCRDRAISNAIGAAIDILHGENKKVGKGAIPDLLKDALAVGFNTTLGHDIFDNANERWDFYHQILERIPFNLEYFNKVTKGGFAKKTLNLYLAGTHVGKTAIMIHQAASNLADGKTVVYISLEMREEEISKRVDANMLGLDIDDILAMPKDLYLKKIANLKARYTGKLITKELPLGSTNVNHIRHFLNELKLKKNIIPDVLYVDYLNLLSSYRMAGNNTANSYTMMKAVSEELRGLAMEMNLCIVSASQFNRGGAGSSDPEMDQISESFGVAFTADFIAALVATDELKEQDKVLVKQLKNRYDDMNRIPSFFLTFKRSKMKFYDSDFNQDERMKISETPKFDPKKFNKDKPTFGDWKI